MVTTRTTVYNTPDTLPSSVQAQAQAQDQEQAQAQSSTSLPTLTQRRHRWAHLLHTQHYHPLVTQVLEQELPKYATSTLTLAMSPSSLIRECILILASAPPTLAAALDGTLARRIREDTPLQRDDAAVQDRAHTQPAIYIHVLADAYGTAPTPNQYAEIRDAVLQYMSSDPQHRDLAHSIDNATPPCTRRCQTAAGYRKYLMTKTTQRSTPHRAALLRFCDGVSRRVAETPLHERDAPMPHPPTECGYSAHAHVRLAQHRQRKSSNYVMNLVEDVCACLYRGGTFTQLFRMHPFIIYLIFSPQQAAVAEIFCSGLMQVWVDEGGGLNAYPAGRSVASAGRVSEEMWMENRRWVEDNSELELNLRRQRERLEEDVLQMDREMEGIWREALDEGDEGGGDGDDPRDLDFVPGELVEELSRIRLDT